MARQSLVPKKKRGPAPTGKGEQVQVRLHQPLLGYIDQWRGKSSRPEAIRALVEMAIGFIERHEYVKKSRADEK